MGARSQSRSRAAARTTELLRRIGTEIRTNRVAASLTLVRVGAAIGRSAAWVSRVERGLMPSVSVTELSQLAAAVGLRLWLNTFPDGPSLRDGPQVQLLQRFRARIGATWSWALEVPIPVAGDARAADAVIRLGQAVVMIEAITRLADAQAQLRAIAIKARDMGIARVVIVVAATHTNRSALRAAQPLLLDQFPLGTKATMRAFAEGREPAANGIVFI